MFMLPAQAGYIDQLAFSPSGLTLASAVVALPPVIQTWDLVDRTPENLLNLDFYRPKRRNPRSPPNPYDSVASLTFFRDDATLVMLARRDEQLCLWDVMTGRTRHVGNRSWDERLCGYAVGADGESLLVGFSSFPSRERGGSLIDVREVDVSTGAERPRLQWQVQQSVADLALRPGNPILVAFPESGTRVVVLSPSREPDGITVPRTGSGPSPAFAPDGRTLALRTARSVRLWDVDARRMIGTVTERTKIQAAAFSPDGRTLATGTTDGVVRLYDVATGHQRAAFDWQIGPVHALAFAPDGMRAAAGGREGKIVVWDVDG